ncbi:hypothetical protein PF005_g30375, partial [Phytophthora fragariae]
VPADARTQEDKLERAITAFALLPTLRQRSRPDLELKVDTYGDFHTKVEYEINF